MKKLCMEVSVVVLQVPFTWDFIFTVTCSMHTHPFSETCHSSRDFGKYFLTARFVFSIGCVFCVEALALRNKKEVEGRRERRYFKKKKASLNDFFALEGRQEKDRLQSCKRIVMPCRAHSVATL